MPNKPFKFKQFEIYQDNSAMKVGTDAVLLSVWARVTRAYHILDVGAGTGIISLIYFPPVCTGVYNGKLYESRGGRCVS